MSSDITHSLLDMIFLLFGAAPLLHAWTQTVQLSPRNPLSQAISQPTGWLARPLHRVILATDCIDWLSLVTAYVIVLVYLFLLVASVGVSPVTLVPIGLVVALSTVPKWTFNVPVWVTTASVVLSWIGPVSPMGVMLNTLADLLLRLIRHVVPLLSRRLNLSSLILLVITQMIVIALSHLSLPPLFM